jgi:hypothetical protein
VFALFLWNAAFFYLPGQGFTYLIQFGDKLHSIYLPQLKAVSHYEMPNSMGYDSQYYAQLAIDPNIADPRLRTSVDGLAYRARRILFPALAYVAGGGDTARVLDAFALENMVAWLALAFLLLKWFPPDSWGNCLRWAAVLFSFGLTFSVARALLDGPSLLLIALGMAAVEAGRPWLAALVLGIAGLGKETNVLAAAALPGPEERSARGVARWMGRAAVVVAPLILWIACIGIWVGKEKDLGDARNFALPFQALAEKLQQSVSQLIAEGPSSLARFDLLVMAGLLAQFFFFVLRIRWNDPWWRLGASYAALMAVLGDAVWENYPTAAARVLLPMTLAFNVLVPRGRRWVALLVLGNLGVLASSDIFKPPGRESYVVRGDNALCVNPKDGRAIEVRYDETRWWRPERNRWEFWRWSKGDATITIHNPQPFTVRARVRFLVRSADVRDAIVLEGERVLWRATLPPKQNIDAALPALELPPGDTVLSFRSDRTAAFPGGNDPRRLSFSVRNFEVDVDSRAP